MPVLCDILSVYSGYLHLMDYKGKGAELGRVQAHRDLPINCIDLDETGEYIGSCADSGVVSRHWLFVIMYG